MKLKILKNSSLIHLIFCWVILQNSIAQESIKFDTVRLNNPSFEDRPQQGFVPTGWTNKGFIGESEPDVHPNGYFEVTNPAYHGNTYLGMVVRQNGTWERVIQELEKPLLQGNCYEFSIFLSMSPNYTSKVNDYGRKANIVYNFTEPVILKIWGGTVSWGRKLLLAESPPINHTEWLEYFFKFTPKFKCNYIYLEAYYKKNYEPYNGNLLLDKCSDIVQIECK